ncbi:2-acylglycerol O-acyltransferase 2-like [Homalodisca vitripennis]|nr:2-acylglycerol O-acyltransferase 2-like [Homalodisca vitripennis]KAG8337729.1 hypothetical protein J6590_015391 [Homalodisca vitripennis]
MQLMGVKFAPLNVSLERRLQTLAAGSWFVALAFGPFICFFVTVYFILFTRYWYLTMLYVAWLVYDRNIAHKGGRRLEFMRDCTWWYYFQAYFPLSLHKTAELPPKSNYLFCVYPHGMLCSGAFGNFATNYSEFTSLYPGLTPYILTINAAFNMPFTRELVLALGACAASKESMVHLLEDTSQPKAVVLMVGGASEAFKCRPGTYRIILKKRKGFIKVALETGTPLVPVFSFGETNLYDQVSNPPGSWLHSVQDKCRKVLGIAPCIPIGRGIFQYNFGVIPRRHPVSTVVGKPIEVPKVYSPSDDVIDAFHEKFTNALMDLFEEHKYRFEVDPENSRLIIE